jgi:phosphatidylserine/phosphatidylglycerophosphate/cardiolipin synthase-like enzyme
VADLETSFRERWEDPAPLTRNPYRRWRDRLLRPTGPAACPYRLPTPPRCGTDAVQVLRTYPYRSRGYAFAPWGERSIARAFDKALRRARRLVYLEEQYLWSPHVVGAFARALVSNQDLRLVAVVPHHPDRDSPTYNAPQLIARTRALDLLHRAGPGRVGVFGIENHAGAPVYVHAKICVIDDEWCVVGSDNLNLRSWTHDSELTCAVLSEQAGVDGLGQQLRLALAREHLDRPDGDDDDLRDPVVMFDEFVRSARALEKWQVGGRRGERPQGRLRPYRATALSGRTARWAEPLYRLAYDPDGRPPVLRRRGTF